MITWGERLSKDMVIYGRLGKYSAIEPVSTIRNVLITEGDRLGEDLVTDGILG